MAHVIRTVNITIEHNNEIKIIEHYRNTNTERKKKKTTRTTNVMKQPQTLSVRT